MPQSFSHQKLQGRSFRGQDLIGADFSGADIRGVDFSHAVLINANFSHARAGQQYRWIISIAAISVILAALAGLLPAFAGGLIGLLLVPSSVTETYNRADFFWISSIISLIVLIAGGWVTVRRGLGSSLGVLAIIVTVATAVVAWAGEGEAIAALIMQFVAIGIVIASIAGGALAISVARSLDRRWTLYSVAIAAITMSVPGALEAIQPRMLSPSSGWIALCIAAITTIFALSFSIYISLAATAGDRKYRSIQALTISLSSLGGTQFRNANLTNADFTKATLKTADFRKATLKRVCWYQAQKLNQAHLEATYLENSDLRLLAVTKEGRDRIYDHLDLRDFNLDNADLQDASFIGADLSEATLQSADLSGAKLVQTQLYKANLTGACLTGAYIQNWGISVDTQLEAVQCKYIYMKLPTKDDPDPCRKPDNRNESFKEGDFADFIAPIITTLDLYRVQNLDLREMAGTFKTLDLFHHKEIDPAAAAVTIQQLSEEYPEAALKVVVLEGRGNQKVRLQAVVAGDVNRSELSAKYFARYKEISSLSDENLQILLAGVAEKDERIHSLERLLENALQQPKFYVETYQHQEEFVMSQSKGNVHIEGVQGNVSGVIAAGESQSITGAAIGAISGSVTNTIEQLSTSDSDSLGIKELLTQLQAAIEAETELADEDKLEALEQVKTLAEAGQKPEDSVLQKAAKTAIKILKGTASSLPDAAKLAEACANLLPAISKLLLLV